MYVSVDRLDGTFFAVDKKDRYGLVHIYNGETLCGLSGRDVRPLTQMISSPVTSVCKKCVISARLEDVARVVFHPREN